MNSHDVERSIAAATLVATALGLVVEDAVIIQNSNKLALRLLPCDIFARIAPAGDHVLAMEIELCQKLVAVGAPVAALDPRAECRVYQHDGFAITLWTYYQPCPSTDPSPVDYADTMKRLHSSMRSIDVVTPHFTDRIAEARNLVANRDRSPALAIGDREFLLDTLNEASAKIVRSGAREQLLHGEPHPGNILNTANGPLFIDLETCCVGPVEFDAAHVPGDVSELYSDLDQDLLSECRRLVLAMVAAWRWDLDDQFPDGLHSGQTILAHLRNGPPWPTLGQLDIDDQP